MKSKIAAAPYIVWMIIFIIAPLLIVFYFAFTDSNGSFTMNNISSLDSVLPIFADSLWLAAIAALICLAIGYPVAYFISRCSPRKQGLLITLIMIPMCMSFLLRTLAWVSILEDTGIINSLLGAIGIGPLKLIRTPAAVVFGMVYNYLPYMILPLYTVMIKIDNSVTEAAEDLGANKFATLKSVIFPLSMPGVISGITMVFVPAVSTFYISQKMGGTTAQIGDVIEARFKEAYDPNFGAAMSLMLMVLIFICMGIMNRFSRDEEVSVV